MERLYNRKIYEFIFCSKIPPKLCCRTLGVREGRVFDLGWFGMGEATLAYLEGAKVAGDKLERTYHGPVEPEENNPNRPYCCWYCYNKAIFDCIVCGMLSCAWDRDVAHKCPNCGNTGIPDNEPTEPPPD